MRRSATAVALGAVSVLATLSLTACGPENVPTAPESLGASEKPRAAAGPDAADPVGEMPGTAEQPDHSGLPDDTEQPIVEPAGDPPELWSIVDPTVGTDGDRDCSPYSIERDYLDGTLTLDDFTRYALFGPWDPESVPEQYRPCPDVNLLSTAGVLWGAQFVEYASPAVQEEVATFLTPTLVPDEG